MKPHYLTPLFAPRTVAVIGASDTRLCRSGGVRQPARRGYQGKLYPVNLNHRVVGGIAAVPNVKMLEPEIDLAVVTTAIRSLPGVMKDCAKRRQGRAAHPRIRRHRRAGKRGDERIAGHRQSAPACACWARTCWA